MKPGKKAIWQESILYKLVEIAVSNDYFRKWMIFQNTKNKKISSGIPEF